MARTTGPVLALGGITLANQALLAKNPVEIDFRVVVGTAIAAGAFALLERLNEPIAVGLAWIALVTVLFVEVDPKAGAPAENLLRLMREGQKKP